MRALITTTINVPSNLREWRRHLDYEDIVVVAGDYKTPHSDVIEFMRELDGGAERNIYLRPTEQERLYPRVSETTGWGCIQRRNLAVLRAMEENPETITTIDDDNYPWARGGNWFDGLANVLDWTHECNSTLVSNSDGWFNPGSLCKPAVTHRGYPLSKRVNHFDASSDDYDYDAQPRIGVVASLWRGDPDIDAVERIAVNPWVADITESVVLSANTWAPFNSQATTVVGELAPLLFMWPGVGRYDDIWASYLARAVMDVRDWHVAYGEPIVKQDRNAHDLVRDLENEIFGMKHNEAVIEILRGPLSPEIIDSSAGINHLMREVFARFTGVDWLPAWTKRAYDAWFEAVSEILRARHA